MTAHATSFSLSAAGWYCLRVLTRREHIAARNLEQRTGLKVFAPRIRVQPGLKRSTMEALFPGYLFARFTFPDEARHVASTPGVVGLVRFGGLPPMVADRVIADLDSEVQRAAKGPAPLAFHEGDWVRVVSGCFLGNEGRVVHPVGTSSRVCVLLTLLGQQVEVSVPLRQLVETSTTATAFPANLRAPAAAPSLPR